MFRWTALFTGLSLGYWGIYYLLGYSVPSPDGFLGNISRWWDVPLVFMATISLFGFMDQGNIDELYFTLSGIAIAFVAGLVFTYSELDYVVILIYFSATAFFGFHLRGAGRHLFGVIMLITFIVLIILLGSIMAGGFYTAIKISALIISGLIGGYLISIVCALLGKIFSIGKTKEKFMGWITGEDLKN